MSSLLRCAVVIPASPAAVRRALVDPSIWTRTMRILGYRLRGAEPAGDHTFVTDSRWYLPWTVHLDLRSADLGISAKAPGPESLRLRIPRLGAVEVKPDLAGTGTDTLTTLQMTIDAPRFVAALLRRRLIAFGEAALGVLTLIAHEPMVIVAGAVIRDAELLAARRVRPPELAGQWELPGGKVEPGESEPMALARELTEELGIRAKIGERIGPDVDLGDGRVLRAYLAILEFGEPAPAETHPSHDLVEWVPVGSAEQVGWVNADRVLVEAVVQHVLFGSYRG